MYKPKDSTRYQPKVSVPIRLDQQCTNAAFGLLLKTSERLMSGRNIREKKALRDYISRYIPIALQDKIIQQCLDKLVGATTTLNLLEIFEPRRILKDNVDLLGPFRLGFGCYWKEGRLTWSQGSAKKFNLTLPQLNQLYNFMLWSKPTQLKEMHIAIARDQVKLSKIPNFLAQARSLTNVTILSGADNNLLRILGLNCPCLATLDVSHSVKVNDYGLQYLLIRPRSRRRIVSETDDANEDDPVLMDLERNPCSQTITSIMLIGTSVSWPGCNLACKLMNFGYLTASLPIIKIVRVKNEGLILKGAPLDRLALDSTAAIEAGLRDVILTSVQNTLLPTHLNTAVLDFYSVTGSKACGDHSLVFVRDNVNSLQIHLYMKMESSNITTLVLPWYTFTWSVDSLIDLDTVGKSFPNLKFLKGRIRGRWHFNEPLLPQLQAAYVWSLNSSTALSMLKNVPELKFLEFNNTFTVAVNNPALELTDLTLEAALTQNISLTQSLESFIIRPVHLTSDGLKLLLNKCPNLVRIGDLESWSHVNQNQIAEINKYLDSIGSQCVLSVMNFPPELNENYQWMF